MCHNKIVKAKGQRLQPEVYKTKGGIKYQIIKTDGGFGGYTLNPGLRLTSDCMLEHPYNEIEDDLGDREKLL